MPLPARTPETQRNSALAHARLSQVQGQLGKANEAKSLWQTAKKSLADVRSAGDQSDDTRIALARVGVAEVSDDINCGDFIAASQAAEDALAELAPVLAKADPSQIATWTDASLRASLGFALSRRELPERAIEQFTKARKTAVAVGALDLSNLVATSGYLMAGWTLGQALATIGKPNEAIPILQETAKLADQLLYKRPGHRAALRGKGNAVSQLAQIEQSNLNWAGAMSYSREAQRSNATVTALDPGNSTSQNNLRLVKVEVARSLYETGRVAEWRAAMQAALVIDKTEKLTGFSIVNLIDWHTDYARSLAQAGKSEGAEAELRIAGQYLKQFFAVSNDKIARLELEAHVASNRARVDMVNGNLDNVEPVLAKHIAIWQARMSELGKDAPTGTDRFLALLYDTAVQALLLKGDYANAASYAQKTLQERQKGNSPTLAEQRDISVARAHLALALARSGKQVDAANAIKPALAFYQLPAVQKSDGVLLKGDHAEALLAAALASPNATDKKALLAQALQRFDAMPAEAKALKDYAQIRADIVGEQRKKS